MLNHNHRFTIFPSVSLSTHCCKRLCMNIFISFKIIKQQKKNPTNYFPSFTPHQSHSPKTLPALVSVVLRCVILLCALLRCSHGLVSLRAGFYQLEILWSRAAALFLAGVVVDCNTTNPTEHNRNKLGR